MPIYEYQCGSCDKMFEKIQKVSEPHMADCPECGAEVQKKVSLSSFALKGTGWYATDYKKAGKTDKAGSIEASSSKSSETPKSTEAQKAPSVPSSTSS
jgi:putative FmdB family regulatory protein